MHLSYIIAQTPEGLYRIAVFIAVHSGKRCDIVWNIQIINDFSVNLDKMIQKLCGAPDNRENHVKIQ